MTLASKDPTGEQNPSPIIPTCSCCAEPAVAWLVRADLKFGPDDPLPNFCDRCVSVLSSVMVQLPKDTDQWLFVDIAWMLRPLSDEETAVWAAEDLLGLNSGSGAE